MITLSYFLSLFFSVTPLLHILYKQKLQLYFVFFITVASFTVLNVLGSTSANVLANKPNFGYYLIFLSMSFVFFVLYIILHGLQKKYKTLNFQERFSESLIEKSTILLMLKILFSISLGGMILFAIFKSPPFFLRKDLMLTLSQLQYTHNFLDERLAHMPHPAKIIGALYNKLLIEREATIMSRPFHWFALSAFEIPLFLVIFSLVLYLQAKIKGELQQKTYKNLLVFFLCFAGLASLWILSKQYITYLLAAAVMTIFIVKNSIQLRTLLIMSAIVFGILFGLYSLYLATLLFNEMPSLMRTLWHRIVEIYPWSSAIAYNMFPAEMPFLQGHSMINLFHLFHFQPVSIANMIYQKIYGTTNGSAPLPALFENYANWSWLGVIAGEIIIGLVVAFFTFLSWSKNIYFFTLAIYASIKLVLFWQAPFWFGTLEPTLIFLMVLMTGIYYLCKFFHKYRHKFFEKNASHLSS